MSIDKSPPWKAVSWAQEYPNDPGGKWFDDSTYWMVKNAAGYTICSDWMTEEQARTIAAAPDLLAALRDCAESLSLARERLGMCGEGDGADRRADAPDDIGSLPALIGARAAITKATVSP